VAIHVGIEHLTEYVYDRAVQLSPQIIRLRPAPHTRTPVHDYRLHIEGGAHRLYWQQDAFGNTIARAVFPEPIERLGLRVELIADTTVINPFDFFVEAYAEHYPFSYDGILRHELAPYLAPREDGPRLRDWVAGVPRTRRRIVEFLVAVNQRLQGDIDYTVRLDPGIQTCEETLERALGSCRDSGWLLVQILRHLGLAARFVSGYLVQLTSDEPSLDGPSGPEEDFTDLHAWAEVYVPGAGWIGLDPTSGLFAGEGHIPLACSPNPESAAPLTGFSEPCEVRLEYHNRVRRVAEDPRVTRPYDDIQWAAVQALGRQVDAALKRQDVRLTLGGEPTFVSVDDMDGAQWNTEALGRDKRERAGRLLRQLQRAFAPGALLHYGQGKWYPGEPLPRWALGCYWREGGEALWRDPQLIAEEDRGYGVDADTALRFGQALSARLGVNAQALTPGYEDWIDCLWREGRRPPDLDTIAVPWAPQFRDDLSVALARGLDRPVGYALPLRWEAEGSGWYAAPWTLEREALYLVPGSSPMGMRLPWGALPRQAARRPWLSPAPSPPATGQGLPTPRPTAMDAGEAALRAEAPRTALCLEPRDGRLYVFLPPAEALGPYAALIRAVEDTAAELGLPVLVEGYPPPDAPGLRALKVTPDPGVIEVNIHPARDWAELEASTVRLYAEARQARLGTEKFMLDGRHTGTGGGNHITLGAAQPQDSPFLRRPDLLRSLITFWQHHPSLSFLFSGLFIGPTSQAPRVDERGAFWVDELESALTRLDRAGTPAEVDGALRSLLADATGNTHRAEFCIDKLWSGDGPGGRQGLVEFRGFEMPPHARMSLVQTLLLRALVALFWERPYTHPPVRWGGLLYDRFLLPHYVWQDFGEVIETLKEGGYALERDWFEAFLEFRFPHYGRARYGEIELELRAALEPWPVLEEAVSAQRQARVVDSAVERLQLRVTGLDPRRQGVCCNGRRVPLQATGRAGEYVAGLRYTAWASVHGRHPTLPADAPLTFDLVDETQARSLGGCVYHVAHPGGRSYERFPVNAYEAEARRITRFWAWGHTPGLEPPSTPEPADAHAPATLDLRRFHTGLPT
jgi:uncharacterized protein (DUF2126 family)